MYLIIEVETRGRKMFYKNVINNVVGLVEKKEDAFKFKDETKADRVRDLVEKKRPESLVSIIEIENGD